MVPANWFFVIIIIIHMSPFIC